MSIFSSVFVSVAISWSANGLVITIPGGLDGLIVSSVEEICGKFAANITGDVAFTDSLNLLFVDESSSSIKSMKGFAVVVFSVLILFGDLDDMPPWEMWWWCVADEISVLVSVLSLSTTSWEFFIG